MIAQFDFQDKMSMAGALDACKNLGNGWRLPTKLEANQLFKNKSLIGGFSSEEYWSTENGGDYFILDMGSGAGHKFSPLIDGFATKYKVRAVKKATK
jgi:hypothetical protein